MLDEAIADAAGKAITNGGVFVTLLEIVIQGCGQLERQVLVDQPIHL